MTTTSRCRTFTLLVLLFAYAPLFAQKKVDSPALDSITSHYWTDYLRINPLTATSMGVMAYNDQLEIVIGKDYMNKGRALASRYLDSANRLQGPLSQHDKLILDIFKFTL